MTITFIRGFLRRIKIAGLFCLAVIVILSVATLIANAYGAGEQNLPFWVLSYLIFYSPAWISFIIFAALVAEYVNQKIITSRIWPAEGTDAYFKELEKVKKYIKRPVRVDMYSRKVGVTITDIEHQIGDGALKGYVYKGRLFIEDDT
jgi:hypothetical protein